MDKKPVRNPIRWFFGLIAFLLLSPFILMFGQIALKVASETFLTRAFDSASWKASLTLNNSDALRQRMVDDLLKSGVVIGKNRDEIVQLLGAPPKTDYFSNFDFVYWLEPERGSFAIDSEWLVIKVGQSGRAEIAKLVRD